MNQIKQALDAADLLRDGPFDHPRIEYEKAVVVLEDAAPDMAAWIKEAALWLERIKEGMESPLMCEPKKYDAIDALLAQVKE